MSATIPLLLLVAAIHATLQFASRMPQVPYNVRELFVASHQNASLGVFSILLVWLGFAPGFVADYLSRRPRQLAIMPIWAALIGSLAWGMLRFSVTEESLWDVLGYPRLAWHDDWELLARFLALQGVVTLPLIVAGVSVGSFIRSGWKDSLARGSLALLSVLPWLCLCWTVVVYWANTDNLTELIRAVPAKWVGPVFLTTLMLLIAFNVSLLSHAWSCGGILSKLIATLALPVFVVPGWRLLLLGLNPAVEKYGMTFPAVQFLLGPDRQTTLAVEDLALRWGVVQTAGVLILAAGGCFALRLSEISRALLLQGNHDHAEEMADQG